MHEPLHCLWLIEGHLIMLPRAFKPMRCHWFLPLGLKRTAFYFHDPAVSSSVLLALIAQWWYQPWLPTVHTCIHLHEVVECCTFNVSPPGNKSVITPLSFITSLTSCPAFSHVVNYPELLSSIILFTSLHPAITQVKCRHSSFETASITLKKCSPWIIYLCVYVFDCAGFNWWFMEATRAPPPLLLFVFIVWQVCVCVFCFLCALHRWTRCVACLLGNPQACSLQAQRSQPPAWPCLLLFHLLPPPSLYRSSGKDASPNWESKTKQWTDVINSVRFKRFLHQWSSSILTSARLEVRLNKLTLMHLFTFAIISTFSYA